MTEYERPNQALLDDLTSFYYYMYILELMLYGGSTEFDEWAEIQRQKIYNRYKPVEESV